MFISAPFLTSIKCIAWKVNDRIDVRLVHDTLEIAMIKGKAMATIIFYSNQRSQFK